MDAYLLSHKGEIIKIIEIYCAFMNINNARKKN